MTPTLEGWPTKAKETPPHEDRRPRWTQTQYFDVSGSKWLGLKFFVSLLNGLHNVLCNGLNQ